MASQQKHPHVRGEDTLINSQYDTVEGNTPTCVGKTSSDYESGALTRKHPHVRGEDTNIL